MQKENLKKRFLKALGIFVFLSTIIVSVSGYFILNSLLIGPVFLFLGIIGLIFLKIFNVKIKSVYPDMVFGAIDNGVLIFAAIFGGQMAGITGAIIGGAVGNTLTDGIGGLFEGHIAENRRVSKFESRRTAISSSLGKMVGCLFGAGVALILVWGFSFIFSL